MMEREQIESDRGIGERERQKKKRQKKENEIDRQRYIITQRVYMKKVTIRWSLHKSEQFIEILHI